MFPKPTPPQRAWQEAERAMFFHFGVNTFTDREWGLGNEDPSLFNPTELDVRQWVHVAKEAGFRYLLLTAKHHDGFCLWQSRYTEHSVKNAAWRNGKGDVVRDLAEACAEAGVKMGIYLSPWDRHEPSYGDSPVYNRYFVNQLTELLSDYGEIAEVWFDGACGEGPNGKRQEYDWPAYYDTVRRCQPNALIAICGPDIRWVGNEEGYAHETEWSVQASHPTFHGNQTSLVWWPAECDVSIRPGWFWHAREDEHVKSLDHLVDIYFKSVGRNSVLLLNVPPNRLGLLSEPDVRRLGEWRRALDAAFSVDLAERGNVSASPSRNGSSPENALDGNPSTFWLPATSTPTLEVDLQRPTTFNVICLQEFIAEGQHIESYRVEAFLEGGWQDLCRGTTVGHKKLDRIPPTTTTRVRLRVLSSRDVPRLRSFRLYHAPALPGPSGS